MILSPSIRSTFTDDGLVLLDMSSGKIFNSNSVGSQIWIKLQDGAAVDAIVDGLSESFSVPRDVLRSDVVAFLDQLVAKGLITEQ